jgi:hypothetical protein
VLAASELVVCAVTCDTNQSLGAGVCEYNLGLYSSTLFHTCFPCPNLEPNCFECVYDVAYFMASCAASDNRVVTQMLGRNMDLLFYGS